MLEVPSEIIEIIGTKPGPSLAIFAGVHGNETAGVLALQELIPKLSITRGKLYVVYANPPAIKANVRFISKNLNRCFFEDNDGQEYEDIRARELMRILDKCDALLDLHMFYDDNGKPFAICEENALDLANKFDVDIISTNWTATEPGGTDGYMFLQGKIGICVECGPISKASEYKDFAIRTMHQFLKHFDMTHEEVSYSDRAKICIKAVNAVYKSSADFMLAPGLHNFDELSAGQVIATDGQKQYVAGKNEYIIFPHYKAKFNEEAYIIGITG